jgi:hypothetical protein
MKTLASVFVGLLLCVSTTVFAVQHPTTALEHTK